MKERKEDDEIILGNGLGIGKLRIKVYVEGKRIFKEWR